MVVLALETLEVRLAESAAEIEAAQALRYRVFYEELEARPTPLMKRRARDVDKFDAYCDYLVVIDRARIDGNSRVVGTYRLMRRSVATAHEGFYVAQGYDVAPPLRSPGEGAEGGAADAEHDQIRKLPALAFPAFSQTIQHGPVVGQIEEGQVVGRAARLNGAHGLRRAGL